MPMSEWTKEQQIWLFLQSGGLGIALGVLFDFFNIPDKLRCRRRLLTFFCDVLFFVLAALVTFYFALAVMDGRMHPLLFCGSIGGFFLEHILLGRYIGGILYRVGYFVYWLLRQVFRWICAHVRAFFRVAGLENVFLRKKCRKIHKKK